MASTGLIRRATQRLWAGARRAVPGQPTPETHPELLAEGDLTAGVKGSEYAERRQRLADALPAGSVAIIPAASTSYMAGLIPYPYRQDADFRYLTGINQDGVAVIESSESAQSGLYRLFVPGGNAQAEQWTGSKLNVEAALDQFGADEAYPMAEMDRQLQAPLSSASQILCSQERDVLREVKTLRSAVDAGRVRQLGPIMHDIRWRKSPAEMALAERSISVAASAMRRCMEMSHVGVLEHQLAATFEYECKMAGASCMSYPQVVAGGPDACTIHYSRNDKRVPDGELVLMDAGCELQGYASDITRAWPVSGTYSKAQRLVYDVVQDVHRRCVEECVVGGTLRAIHQLSIQLLSEGLAELRIFGLLPPAEIAREPYRLVYPHSVGHWLGMDTHDTSTIRHDRLLQDGVIMAIEPGLYIPDEPRFGDFAGIGIRIEDDVAITANGPRILSKDVPSDPLEIERLIGSRKL